MSNAKYLFYTDKNISYQYGFFVNFFDMHSKSSFCGNGTYFFGAMLDMIDLKTFAIKFVYKLTSLYKVSDDIFAIFF